MSDLPRTPSEQFDDRTGVVWRRRRADGLRIPTVRVVAGPDLLASYAIYPTERVIIGRDMECDLVLSDDSVSRRHAIVEWKRGKLYLEDLGSTNGTSIGRAGVVRPVELPQGEVFYVGNVALRIDPMTIEEIQHLERVAHRLTQASRDDLTGLLGRGWLEQQLPGLVARNQLRQTPLAALFIDVDHFKQINDTFGHALGDQVLRTTAQLLLGTVREGDRVVRYGGEEFLVVLNHCDRQGAERVAKRLLHSIRTHQWSAYVGDEERSLAVTISLGVAVLTPDESHEDWLQRADMAMYAAKGSGRDRVMYADEPVPA
ncbi:MAG: GGDEF domain-containing protein [Myxococcales bacterium]|nr:GGDEF domain-containing protein [Myxococcales bacterium]